MEKSFTVTVNNQDPTGRLIPSQTLELGEQHSIDLSDYFSDPDGDELSYTVSVKITKNRQ